MPQYTPTKHNNEKKKHTQKKKSSTYQVNKDREEYKTVLNITLFVFEERKPDSL
jgi:hypothetical protein